jgi:general secretion pathway protein D
VKSDEGRGILGQTLIPPAGLGSNSAVAFNFTGIGGDWDLGIRMLQQFGNTKVLSSPKIMAVNNQTALLKVVNNEVYFTIEVNREAATTTSAGTTTYETEVHTVPVGFMMSVTPFVSDKDDVSLNIRPTISRIVGYVNDPSPDLARENITSRIPVIQEREMASVLKLKDNQTAVIGGLIEDSNMNDKNAGIGRPVLLQG